MIKGDTQKESDVTPNPILFTFPTSSGMTILLFIFPSYSTAVVLSLWNWPSSNNLKNFLRTENFEPLFSIFIIPMSSIRNTLIFVNESYICVQLWVLENLTGSLKPRLCHFLNVWLCAGYLTSLCSVFSSVKRLIITVPASWNWED